MAIFTRFLGSSVSVASGVAIGGAVRPALDPLVQAISNETWKLYPDVPPDAVLLAIGVAQGQVDESTAREWASQTGFGSPQMDALIAVADTGPGVAQAFELWRRGLIGEDGFRRAAKREAIEPEWIDALVGLKRRLLSPAELANAVVQGFRTEPDAAADAVLQGYDAADFQTMVAVTGLPPGPETLQDWVRRGIATEAELEQGIREGHTKTKYVPFYRASLTKILSAAEWATAHLKGHATAAEMYAGGAADGYDKASMDLLFLDRGRPATPRQIRVGFERGAKVIGTNLTLEQAIAKAVEQSDIRPEYADIESAASYSLPSPFVLRGLTQSGAFTQAQAEKILLQSGWLPEYAQAAAAFFAKGATGKTASETKAELADEYETGFISEAEYRAALTGLGFVGHEQDLEVLHSDAAAVKTERGRVITALHKLFVNHKLDDARARADLASAGMHDQAISRVLPLWTLERDAARHELTDAQLRAAYRKALITLDTAVADLVARGYTDADARTYLAS